LHLRQTRRGSLRCRPAILADHAVPADLKWKSGGGADTRLFQVHLTPKKGAAGDDERQGADEARLVPIYRAKARNPYYGGLFFQVGVLESRLWRTPTAQILPCTDAKFHLLRTVPYGTPANVIGQNRSKDQP